MEKELTEKGKRTKQLAEISAWAALYAVLTWTFAPISYQVLQFRLAECLKSIVVPRKHLILAFVIGNALSNILSPFAGLWEFVWMPLINLFGASTAWFFGSKLFSSKTSVKAMFFGGTFYAIWVAFGVAFMLCVLFNLPLLVTFAYLLVPEFILIACLSPVMHKVNRFISKNGTL